MCLRINSPATSRVGSGGCPGRLSRGGDDDLRRPEHAAVQSVARFQNRDDRTGLFAVDRLLLHRLVKMGIEPFPTRSPNS
jgi:hypothetical protein